MSGSRHHHAFAGLSAKNKAAFHNADNGEASRMPKNARRDAFLGQMAKLPDRGGRRLTVSCSVAFAPISDKEKIVRMKNSFFIAAQVLRGLKGAWTGLFNKDVDLPRLLGERR
jgi:hypothetical protein